MSDRAAIVADVAREVWPKYAWTGGDERLVVFRRFIDRHRITRFAWGSMMLPRVPLRLLTPQIERMLERLEREIEAHQ